ncbi:hypothetical protein ATOBIA_N04430 [Atopobiaceae bacterium P1]|nr:hypothetical protein ATOBIA_N04430 [Atopobiaceae bacterium P1]
MRVPLFRIVGATVRQTDIWKDLCVLHLQVRTYRQMQSSHALRRWPDVSLQTTAYGQYKPLAHGH